MKINRGAVLLLVPGVGILLAFLVLPLANVVEESFRLFEPGRIGAAKDAPYTWFNYAELLNTKLSVLLRRNRSNWPDRFHHRTDTGISDRLFHCAASA